MLKERASKNKSNKRYMRVLCTYNPKIIFNVRLWLLTYDFDIQ